jgi:hypothetical protein
MADGIGQNKTRQKLCFRFQNVIRNTNIDAAQKHEVQSITSTFGAKESKVYIGNTVVMQISITLCFH